MPTADGRRGRTRLEIAWLHRQFEQASLLSAPARIAVIEANGVSVALDGNGDTERLPMRGLARAMSRTLPRLGRG
ncbi:MAG TPA: hypothetical protein VL689_15725 [Paraburkholderia sp.]|jgi:hypothetical protein|nr:hypothetical protein [Paraburkholderia sp.]